MAGPLALSVCVAHLENREGQRPGHLPQLVRILFLFPFPQFAPQSLQHPGSRFVHRPATDAE